MSKIGRWWANVKARLQPARKEAVLIAAVCPACRREIDASVGWINWKGALWHIECVARRRGWKLEGPPEEVVPDRSVKRFEARAVSVN